MANKKIKFVLKNNIVELIALPVLAYTSIKKEKIIL